MLQQTVKNNLLIIRVNDRVGGLEKQAAQKIFWYHMISNESARLAKNHHKNYLSNNMEQPVQQ